MAKSKTKLVENRRRISLAMRPDVHDRLRLLAKKRNLSMSRLIELLVIDAND